MKFRGVSRDPDRPSPQVLLSLLEKGERTKSPKAREEYRLVLADGLEMIGYPMLARRALQDSSLNVTQAMRAVLRGGSYSRFDVRSLDVWGNARDGYEINNSWRAGQVQVYSRLRHPSNSDIIKACRENYLRNRLRFTIDDSGSEMFTIEHKGRPVLQFEQIEHYGEPHDEFLRSDYQ